MSVKKPPIDSIEKTKPLSELREEGFREGLDYKAWLDTLDAMGLDHETRTSSPKYSFRPRLETANESWEQWTQSLPKLPVSFSSEDDNNSDYEIREVLGKGGMGVVYLSHQRSLQRNVAIKKLRLNKLKKSDIVSLLQEARYTGILEHPNIIPIHALGLDENNYPVLVMKRIEGVSWSELIYNPNHPNWQHVQGSRLEWHIRVLLQVCHAIHFAHSHGVIHRDLKTENIMIGNFGEVYVLDWGVAMEVSNNTDSPKIVGTPAYMAPEQATPSTLSFQTDVYLLGACLYEAMTNTPPHQGETFLDVLKAARRNEIASIDPKIPQELQTIVFQAMHTQPEERYQNILDFQHKLEDFLLHFDSLRLEQAARQKLENLQREIQKEDWDDLKLQRSFSTARFGFEQALETWPENKLAQEGLDVSLELMCKHALQQGDHHQAQRLIHDLELSSEKPTQEFSLLVTELEKQIQEHEKLQNIQFEQNIEISRRQRTIAAIILGSFLTLGFTLLAYLDFQETYTPTHSLHITLLIVMNLFFVIGFVFLGRKWSLQTKTNRQISLTLSLMMFGSLFQGILSAILNLPISTAFTLDYVTVTLSLSSMVVFVEANLLVAPLCFAIAAISSAIWPELYLFSGVFAVFLAHFFSALLWLQAEAKNKTRNRLLAQEKQRDF